jgi:hypothetical protein
MTPEEYKIREIVDVITNELFAIEESARMFIGCTALNDQLLHELNFPGVSELIHVMAD